MAKAGAALTSALHVSVALSVPFSCVSFFPVLGPYSHFRASWLHPAQKSDKTMHFAELFGESSELTGPGIIILSFRLKMSVPSLSPPPPSFARLPGPLQTHWAEAFYSVSGLAWPGHSEDVSVNTAI